MVKKGDSVVVLAGSSKGKKGTVLKVFPKASKVVVEGVNVKKRHEKAKTADGVGKVIDKAMPIHVSNVKLAK